MAFNFKEIFTASMVLFAVIDIIGNIPIVITLRKKAGHIHSEKASVIAAIVMIFFLFISGVWYFKRMQQTMADLV